MLKVQWNHFKPTRLMAQSNRYLLALDGEFSAWAYNETRARDFLGSWRSRAFDNFDGTPNGSFDGNSAKALDIEIGPGTGMHFSHYAQKYPERYLLGIELSYKPLIQSIRRALKQGSMNARVARYNACYMTDLFALEEVNDIIIHFPDPWPKTRHLKNRLINLEFLEQCYSVQRLGSKIEIKTDSRPYYEWMINQAKKSRYNIAFCTANLHRSDHPLKNENYVTYFERIFLLQNIAICCLVLTK